MIAAAFDRSRPATPEANDGLVHFPRGVLGFPHVSRYRLLEGPGAGLYWLTGTEPGDPSFLLSDPFVHFEDISLELMPAHVDQIEAEEAAEVAVLAVTVPHPETGNWTANLQGPIVINMAKRLGAQVVLPDQSLGLRRPFRPVRT